MQACIPSTSRAALQPVLRATLLQQANVRPFSISSSRRAGLQPSSGSEDWIRKQMRMAERMNNRKTKVNIKQDQDVAFARYVPPPKSGYSFLSNPERWATAAWCRILNWYQNKRAGANEFGHPLIPRIFQRRFQKTVKEDIIPLYKQICEAQATGQLERLEGRLAQSLHVSIEDAALLAQRRGERRSWRMHGTKAVTVPTVRLNEMTKGEEVLQLVARFESDQSLEVRDASGRLKPNSGRHNAPIPIVENMVFQKKAFGYPEAEVRALGGKQKRASTLTVV